MPQSLIKGHTIHHHNDYLGKWYNDYQDFYEVDFLSYSILGMKTRKTEDVIIDVGANIGNHTLYRAANGHKVIAFEPSEDNYNLLQKNIAGLQVRGYNSALSNMSHHYEVIKDIRNRGGDAIVEMPILQGRNADYPKTQMLDDIVKEPVKLIKVDVEGMELQVLQGAYLTIQRYLPDLMVEVNDKDTRCYIEHLGYKKAYGRRHNKTFYFRHSVYV